MLLAGILAALGCSWRLPFVIAVLPNSLLAPLLFKLVKEIRVGFGFRAPHLGHRYSKCILRIERKPEILFQPVLLY